LDVERPRPAGLPTGPVSFCMRLQQLGPAFVKFGQYMALRPDILPQEYTDRLMLLSDEAPQFTWTEARAILTEDLGGDPTEIFASVNMRPIAAGTLAQAYLARLKDGAEVVVRVQRPGIKSQMLRDLQQTRLLEQAFKQNGISPAISPRHLVSEVTAWILRELDFSQEMVNIERMYNIMAGSVLERVPRPFPGFSSPRVITTEHLQGVSMSALLSAWASGHEAEVERVDSLGFDPDRVAGNLSATILRQIFQYRFFHVNVHPTNLLVLPDNLVAFVSFGSCTEIDEYARERLLDGLSFGYGSQTERIFSALNEVLVPSRQTDVEAFRRDFEAETRALLAGRTANGNGRVPVAAPGAVARPYDTARSTDLPSTALRGFIGLMRAASVHRVRVPAPILDAYCALVAVDTIARQIGSIVDLEMVGKDFLNRLRLQRSVHAFEPENLQPVVLGLLELLRDSPDQLRQILSELSDGRLTLNMYTLESPRAARSRNKRVTLLATSILSVSLAILVAIPDVPAPYGFSLRWIFLAVLFLLYIWLYLQWRRLR
jgi:ubiquinone biosynthesis protein